MTTVLPAVSPVVGNLLGALLRRGISVYAKDGALAVSPAGVLQAGEREALRANKADVLALLRARDALLGLEHTITMVVPWESKPLYVVPGPAGERELREQGIEARRVWCRCELIDHLYTGTWTHFQAFAEARVIFGGATVCSLTVRAARPA